MDESEFLQDHLLKIRDLKAQLNAIGQKMGEDMVNDTREFISACVFY